MSKNITGGCFCGEVRYEITGDPVLQLLCFCKDCLSITGTDGYAGYMVKNSDFQKTSGKPTVHKKISKEGRTVNRNFCGVCGSNLWGETEFGLISVTAGSLDDANLFQPTKKVFTQDTPHWARIPDDLEEM
ncbi:GFA family protein [Kiloniella sp.]|uniref:GFA family protein n=1 Tax=Kiloniella sp. TaxID=1938587 RepID=UPI003B01B916